jgi:hypothetical protein
MAKNNKDLKEQNTYQNLQDRYSEMSDFMSVLVEDCKQNETDLRYLNEFIRYKKLTDEYQYFRENAHEEYEEDMPFSYLTI